jgi:putative OPT family oligopeptide transporter
VIFLGAVLNRWVAMPIYASIGDPGSIVTNLELNTQAIELAKLYPGVIDAGGAALVGTVREALFDTSWVNPQFVDPFGMLDQKQLGLALRSNAQTMPLESIDSVGLAGTYHGRVTRFLGVGGMLVGGMWSLFKLRKSLLGGVKAGLDAYKRARGGGDNTMLRTERDMPMNIILILIVASLVPLFFIFWHIADSPGIAAVMAIVMLIAGFLFSAVASYMAGLVGSSNNPVSGITVSTILVSALLLLGLGAGVERGPIAAILIGSVVCCAAAIGGDNLQDLKCGQLVGSTPWKQQVMQILGVVAAAFVMAPILNLLNDSYGIGEPTPEHPKPLNAPQATLMGSVANGVFRGGLPVTVIAVGAAIAVGIIVIDIILQKRQSSVRIPVMAFAVGVYLPFDLNVPIMLGGIVALIVQRHLDRTQASPERRGEVERMGLLAAAGFITGEALMGIGIAVPTAALASQDNKTPLALFGGKLAEYPYIALIFVAVSLWLLYKLALTPSKKK